MKQTKTTELLVGVFIVAGVAALFVLAMKVSNLSSFSQADGYTLTAHFENTVAVTSNGPEILTAL